MAPKDGEHQPQSSESSRSDLRQSTRLNLIDGELTVGTHVLLIGRRSTDTGGESYLLLKLLREGYLREVKGDASIVATGISTHDTPFNRNEGTIQYSNIVQVMQDQSSYDFTITAIYFGPQVLLQKIINGFEPTSPGSIISNEVRKGVNNLLRRIFGE